MYIIVIAIFCFANFGDSVNAEGRFLIFRMDKVVHFIMFVPFSILAYLSFEHKHKSKIESIKFFLKTLLIGILVAASTEVIQSKLPYRALEISDFIADSLAVFLGGIYVLIVNLLHIKKKGRKSR